MKGPRFERSGNICLTAVMRTGSMRRCAGCCGAFPMGRASPCDRGGEMARHRELGQRLADGIYFTVPASPSAARYQRGHRWAPAPVLPSPAQHPTRKVLSWATQLPSSHRIEPAERPTCCDDHSNPPIRGQCHVPPTARTNNVDSRVAAAARPGDVVVVVRGRMASRRSVRHTVDAEAAATTAWLASSIQLQLCWSHPVRGAPPRRTVRRSTGGGAPASASGW